MSYKNGVEELQVGRAKYVSKQIALRDKIYEDIFHFAET